MSSPPRTLPTFVIVGATKAGTTSLYKYLEGHPQVFLPRAKELKFFSSPVNWRLGVGWYARQFAAGAQHPARGEATPSYSMHPHLPDVPRRMASVIPDARLVYLVRESLARMRSHYLHRLLLGLEQRPIDEALLTDPVYLDGSRYGHQLDQYAAHFPRDQILVIPAERLRADRAGVLADVCAHLRVDPALATADLAREHNRTEDIAPKRPVARPLFVALRLAAAVGLPKRTIRRWSYRPIDREVPVAEIEIGESAREELARRLAPDVGRLREWLGPDFAGWGLASRYPR